VLSGPGAGRHAQTVRSTHPLRGLVPGLVSGQGVLLLVQVVGQGHLTHLHNRQSLPVSAHARQPTRSPFRHRVISCCLK
jgi:hypothetical protein